jgi:anti-anti-sigma regulatory factor
MLIAIPVFWPCSCFVEGEREEMLKITITSSATEENWTLYGRLVAPWVDELKTSWKRVRRTAQRRKCIVNLDEVTFIDKCGERMLRSMSNQGAKFVASDVYVKHVLDRLKCKSK